jgi:thiol-disulfide isomerase/thioredoxin
MRLMLHSLATGLGATILLGGVLSSAVSGVCRAASEAAPFSQAAFTATQRQGKSILIEVTAPWCPVCAKLRPVLSELLSDPAYKDLVIYNIDFDSQKIALRNVGVQMEGTLIVYNGTTEKGRTTGVSDPDAVKALLEKTIQ